MISWRLVLLVAVCVSLDFGSPFVAGAFRFSADDSLEGLSSPAGRIQPGRFAAPSPLVPMHDSSVRALVPGRGSVGRRPEQWVVEFRQSHALESQSPSSIEDH
jgi:hypothetical protein